MNKEELKELLKDDFEECDITEATHLDCNGYFILNPGYLKFITGNSSSIYFKQKQKFPIVFEGENMNFEIRLDNDKIPYLFIDSQRYYNLEEKDIEANKRALNKLKELKELDSTSKTRRLKN